MQYYIVLHKENEAATRTYSHRGKAWPNTQSIYIRLIIVRLRAKKRYDGSILEKAEGMHHLMTV